MNDQSNDSMTVSDFSNVEVFTIDSSYVGTVKQPLVDFTEDSLTGLLIEDCNNELFLENPPNEIVIPYEWVRSAGDVILVSSIQEDMLTY